MAHLRVADDEVAVRFRQRPRGSLPQNVHPGQPTSAESPDVHYDRTRASEQANIDTAQAQAAAAHDQGGKPTVTPQSPPFLVHSAKITPIPATGSRER